MLGACEIRPPDAGIEVMGSRGIFASDYNSFHLWKLDKDANPRAAKLSELHEIEGLFEGRDVWTYLRQRWNKTSVVSADVQHSVHCGFTRKGH